jgi:hypothetical protein
VLVLLQRVPQQEVEDGRIADAALGLRVGQQDLGERRGVVLEGGGRGEVGHRGQVLLALAQTPAGEALDPLGRVAELVEAVVERAVLAAVHGLLPDEAGDGGLERGVLDAVAVVADRADEEVLAVGKDRRGHGHDVAHEQVTVAGVVLGHVGQRRLERDAAGGDRTAHGHGSSFLRAPGCVHPRRSE